MKSIMIGIMTGCFLYSFFWMYKLVTLIIFDFPRNRFKCPNTVDKLLKEIIVVKDDGGIE